MNKRICAIVATVERLDLVRQLVESYRSTWFNHVETAVAALPPGEPGGIVADLPSIMFAVSGNDDATEGWLRNQAEQGAPFGLVRFPAITPYAPAVNAAVKAALEQDPTIEWLLLLNNDLILQPGFWAGLQEAIDLGYEVIGAKLLYPNGTIQHYGKFLTLDMVPFHVLRYQPADHSQAQQVRPFPDVTFACVAIKREIWEDLGGLDEGYQNGYEDDEFCFAARERGAQIGVHPGVLAIHLEAQTSGIDTANKAKQFERFHQKWIESGRCQWVLGVFQGWSNA